MTSISLVFNINAVASTGITFTPAAPFTGSGTTFTSPTPVAAGVTIGTIAVTPSGWVGQLSTSGANASSFTLNGSNLVTAAALPAGSSDTVTVTATP